MNLEEDVKRIDAQITKETQNLKSIKLEISEKESQLELIVKEQTELAFKDYMNQQSAHFENIARTYGNKVGIHPYILL